MLIDTINELCLERLGREPNLENPKGFNDCIQWLKLHDQRKEQITACDKWGVRSMVPKGNLVPARLGVAVKWMPCVMKCTHDCGSIQFMRKPGEIAKVQKALKESLGKTYGAEKGEWAYQFIKPRVITERLIEPGITDYKFHCSHGKIRWVQVIAERGHEDGPRETILSPEGKVLPLHMDQNMRHIPEDVFPGDDAWSELTKLARRLAKPWRYVRVDLYWKRQAWFGELTFWPLAGCYLTDDEPEFGRMLELDLSVKLEPIVK